MKKALGGLTIVVAVLAVLWAGSVLYVGQQIESSLDDFALAFNNSADVLVHRLDYESGMFEGQIHYDLEWQPDPNSEWGIITAALSEQLGELRTSGTLDVRHGPFLGGAEPFGLARLEWTYELPDDERASLPQYPGDTPVVTSNTYLAFDGSLLSQLTTVEYDGLLVEDSETSALTMSGLNGSLELNNRTASAHLRLTADEFRLAPGSQSIASGNQVVAWEDFLVDVMLQGTAPDMMLDVRLGRVTISDESEGFSLDLEGFVVRSDATQLQPAVWLGESEFALGLVGVEASGFTAALRNITSSTNTELGQTGHLEAVNESVIASIELGDSTFNDLRIDSSFRNIDVDAYSAMSQIGTNIEAAMANPQVLLDDFLAASNDLLAGHPIISLDRISLSVVEEEDINFSTSVAYTGDVQLQNFEEAMLLVDDLEVEGEVYLATAAVRRLIEVAQGTADPTLRGSALQNAVDAELQGFISSMHDAELMSVSDDALSASMQLRNGEVTLNGVELGSTEDLLANAMAPAPDDISLSGTQVMGGPVNMQPDFLAEPRFERVNLVNGFTPDPHNVPVMASGQRMAYEVLGADCTGNVNSSQPDITLSYVAGTDFSLYIYAESGFDTMLVVLSPQGWLCDDDSHGDFNPGVSIDSPETGDYMIWVGTYEEGVAKARLGISEY